MNRPVPAGLTGLSDFRPAQASEPQAAPVPSARAIAEAHGFVERNPQTIRKRRKPTEEPTYSFTARVSVRSANEFIEWCERERMSYREGFDRLVAKIERA